MSELLQSGQHPDADQLSAFVEHVLPAHEQEETLAHLAVCSACRSIVALSLPAVEERPIPQPVRRPWFSGWNLVWSGTAALAATVLVGVLLRNSSSVTSPAQGHAPPAQTAKARPLPPPVVLHQLRPEAAGTVTQQTPPLSSAASVATAATKRKTAEVPPGLYDRQLQTAPPVSGVEGGIANRAATPAFGGAKSSVSVTTASDALQTEEVALHSMLGADQAQVILSHHALPSGLQALSAVANGRQAVAIDAHNALFLSDDGGEHWSAISPPWESHAVKVELASSTTGNTVDAMGAAAAFKPSPAPVSGLVSSEPETQAKSSIRGDVTDLSGASIPNVSVSVTNSQTQVSRTTRTDGSGHYAVDDLDPGTYALEAEAPGFVSQQLSGVALPPAQQSQMNLRLAVGSVSQTVEVQGQDRIAPSAPPVEAIFASRRPILSRFEITTDTGEKWTSADGRSWKRK
jgi:Carboxypeptidase regulatory-like domain/Putative zinc-finger